MTNAELAGKFRQVAAGDRNAFAEIYADMSRPVFTVLLRLTKNYADAEDLLQELFLKLYQSPPGEAVGNLRAYIFRMAHNAAVDHLRVASPDPIDDSDEALLGTTDDAGEIAAGMTVMSALETLSVTERGIISLHVNANLKFREIAAITGKPEKTVYTIYKRAIQKLYHYMNGGKIS